MVCIIQMCYRLQISHSRNNPNDFTKTIYESQEVVLTSIDDTSKGPHGSEWMSSKAFGDFPEGKGDLASF